MRKIELDMNHAIRLRQDWRKDNTEVAWMEDGTGEVLLHGNSIARVHPAPEGAVLELNWQTFRRWPTRTTMSRLRALGFNVSAPHGEARAVTGRIRLS